MKKTNENNTMTAEGYFTKSEYQKRGERRDPEGYTPNAWWGKNHPRDRFLPVKEVAQRLREYIKSEAELKACKWSITTDSYSGGQSITVALMEAPFEAIRAEWAEKHAAGYKNMTADEWMKNEGYHQHGTCEQATTPQALALFIKVRDFLTSWNYDDSDGMVDYFDRGFYDWYHVGKWDKPFKKVDTKAIDKYIKIATKHKGTTRGHAAARCLAKRGYIVDGICQGDAVRERLEELRQELREERISTGELIELQRLAKFIDEDDIELREAAGVPEFEKEGDGVDLPAIVPSRANLEGVQLVEYSEKAFAVVGNTKELREELKALGGRFNSHLSCGAGWIFSKKAENKVRARLCL